MENIKDKLAEIAKSVSEDVYADNWTGIIINGGKVQRCDFKYGTTEQNLAACQKAIEFVKATDGVEVIDDEYAHGTGFCVDGGDYFHKRFGFEWRYVKAK